MNTGSIGVFDSGVGGLSLLREVRRELPHEDVIYVADSGHAPYGDKPVEIIRQRSSAIVGFLVRQGAKAVVVACNTATSVAVDGLRRDWTIPIVAIEPAVKPAAATTRSGVVGVLATGQTIASPRFARLTDTFAAGVEVIAQPCPGLVEQIEKGDLSGPAPRALLEVLTQEDPARAVERRWSLAQPTSSTAITGKTNMVQKGRMRRKLPLHRYARRHRVVRI